MLTDNEEHTSIFIANLIFLQLFLSYSSPTLLAEYAYVLSVGVSTMQVFTIMYNQYLHHA